MKIRIKYSLFIIAFLAFPVIIQAQSGAKLSLKNIEEDQFPLISGSVDVRDASGNFLFGLDADDFSMMENGNPRPLNSLRLTDIPVRIAVVINPSEAFSIRDVQGLNRFDYVRQALAAWVNTIEDEINLSLISQAGLEIPFRPASEWLGTFQNFEADFSVITPDLQALSSALVVTAQSEQQEGAATAILLITASPSAESLSALEDIAQNVESLGVPISIWLVDSSARFNLDEVLAMQNLAISSGGDYYGFSGTEGLPDPQDYFADLGNIYRFQYSSELRESGQHELILNLNNEEFSLSSQAAQLDIKLEAPKPIFLSPPAFIQRAASEEDPELLSPFSQSIEIIIEFPDGFERNLLRSTLKVNGESVAENRTAPFTHFSWDISNLLSNQSLQIQVEIEDELGLVGNSVELPVKISVLGAPDDVSGAVVRNVPQFVLVMALLLGGGVFVFMVLTGRISPPALLTGNSETIQSKLEVDDPLLELPSSIADMAQPFSDKRARIPLSDAKDIEKAKEFSSEPAYLLPLSEEGHPMMAEMRLLEGREHIFGSNKEESQFLVKDKSVDARHSIIRRKKDGSFEIIDLGKESGTWVNYAPISEQGSDILNGDLIHIGRATFRFFLEKPTGRAFMERR